MKEKRIEKILEEIEKNGIVSVNELSQKLSVTRMTIGRDLKLLEDNNIVKRIHGGAVKNSDMDLMELTHLQKKEINVENKEEIGRIASRLIDNGDILFIGASTTNEFLMKNIKDKRIRIITNSYYIFEQYKNNENFELIITGGWWREKSGAFVGEAADKMLSNLEVDKCFIGANGIKDNLITNSNKDEASLQNIIMNNSKKNFLLIDSNKFELKDSYSFYKIEDLDAIVTDSKLDTDIKEKYSVLTVVLNK